MYTTQYPITNTFLNSISDQDIKKLNQEFLKEILLFKTHSSQLPPIDKLQPLQRAYLAIFGCQLLKLLTPSTDSEEASYNGFQELALEGLSDRLYRREPLTQQQQQAFIDSVMPIDGNDWYPMWFMEVKCAVAFVELKASMFD
jgi:hypothetical protein